MRTTHTYATCNIVVVKRTTPEPTIYAEDFGHPTNESDIIGGLPAFVADHINVKNMRVFQTMSDFTEWLAEIGAIVGKCVCR